MIATQKEPSYDEAHQALIFRVSETILSITVIKATLQHLLNND
jgi:hypothetical protein